VEDNGLGAPDAPPRSEAVGLRAVQRRLELKYQDATLRLQSSPGGTRAIVELPLTLGAPS
jgi:LytS/YehU family sensor histidine kinase